MQKAVLVGLNVNNDPGFEKSLREMAALAEAAEIEVTETLTQNLPARISGTLIGSGKIEEVREAVLAQEAELVLFDSTLSPVQMRNLNRLLETELLACGEEAAEYAGTLVLGAPEIPAPGPVFSGSGVFLTVFGSGNTYSPSRSADR